MPVNAAMLDFVMVEGRRALPPELQTTILSFLLSKRALADRQRYFDAQSRLQPFFASFAAIMGTHHPRSQFQVPRGIQRMIYALVGNINGTQLQKRQPLGTLWGRGFIRAVKLLHKPAELDTGTSQQQQRK